MGAFVGTRRWAPSLAHSTSGGRSLCSGERKAKSASASAKSDRYQEPQFDEGQTSAKGGRYPKQQIEEEKTLRHIVTRLKAIGSDQPALLDFDKDLGDRSGEAADGGE